MNRNRRSHTLPHLILRLVVSVGCINAVVCFAYFYYRFRGLPPGFQGSTDLTLLALCLSIANICVGIRFAIPPFTSFLSKILVRGNEFYGYGCLSLGAGCFLIWLNSKFAISWAFIASLLPIALASVLFGISAKMLASQIRAGEKSGKMGSGLEL